MLVIPGTPWDMQRSAIGAMLGVAPRAYLGNNSDDDCKAYTGTSCVQPQQAVLGAPTMSPDASAGSMLFLLHAQHPL